MPDNYDTYLLIGGPYCGQRHRVKTDSLYYQVMDPVNDPFNYDVRNESAKVLTYKKQRFNCDDPYFRMFAFVLEGIESKEALELSYYHRGWRHA